MRENVKHWTCILIVIFADEKEAEPKNVPEARRFTHLRSLSDYQAARRSAKESPVSEYRLVYIVYLISRFVQKRARIAIFVV